MSKTGKQAPEEQETSSTNLFSHFKLENPLLKSESSDEDVEEEIEEESSEEEEEVFEEKEEVEEVPVEEEVPVAKKKTVESESVGTYQGFMEHLAGEGILTPDDEKEYEDSELGLQEAVQDTIAAGVKSYREGLGTQSQELIKFIEDGGTVQQYVELHEELDYKDVDLEDEDNHEQLVVDFLEKSGYTSEEIKETVQDYKEGDSLGKQAKIAHRKLISLQEQEREAKVLSQSKVKKEQEASFQRQQEDFRKLVTSTTEIKGFKIDSKTAAKLHDYITKPVDKKGRSKLSVEYSEESQLLFAYLMMNNFNYEKLEKAAETKAAIKIKRKMDQYTDKSVMPRKTLAPYEDEESDGKKLKLPKWMGH